MKKIIIFAFVLVLLGVAFFYFYNKNQRMLESNKVVYNSITQKWEKFNKEDVLAEDRKDILEKLDNTDGTHNQSVLKGYFEKYNESNQALSIKTVVPFSQTNLFETLELKLLPNQTIYCAPSIYTDPNTGKSYSINKLIMPVKDGETLWLPTEKVFNFDEFLTKSTDKTFIYLQLTENYDQLTPLDQVTSGQLEDEEWYFPEFSGERE